MHLIEFKQGQLFGKKINKQNKRARATVLRSRRIRDWVFPRVSFLVHKINLSIRLFGL